MNLTGKVSQTENDRPPSGGLIVVNHAWSINCVLHTLVLTFINVFVVVVLSYYTDKKARLSTFNLLEVKIGR
jgi:hypothetical protein